MRTRWFVAIVMTALVIQSIVVSNKYKVISKDGYKLYVNRKGQTLMFYDPTNSMNVGDSIRLFSDYDVNYKALIVESP